MKTNDITKGMKIQSVQLGEKVTGTMMDNKKGDIRMVDTKGSEVGMFDEIGSIYSHDIVAVEVDGEWVNVEHTEKQIKLKYQVNDFFAGGF